MRYAPAMALSPCPSCERHVKQEETTCPFCAGALGAVGTGAATESGHVTTQRGTRALMLFGAGVLAMGCGPRAQTTIYGGPPPPEPTATATTAPGASTAPAMAPVAMYGAPAPSDMAPPTDPKKR